MNSRVSGQSPMCNSLAIRQEIQRFESVHPSIYAIYDLIEVIPDTLIQQQIREHVVCIEDSFVNSQEWTISRSVQDLKLGILGSVHSGKSALVHRYLTGSYMQEESPEGGRFKKEVVLDGQSYLLLIRDEGGAPEMQFTHWVDAIIFVFSLENEPSFNSIYSYYAKMAHYRKTTEIPLILVGTQDSISESNPRVIDDSRARKLANDLKHCSYYETCATYGLNVERVFQDACQKILQMKLSSSGSRPNTPNHGAGVGGVGGMGGGVAPSPRGYYTQGPSQQGHSPPMRDGMKEKDKHKRHNRAMDGHDMSAHTHATGGSHTLTRGGGSSGGSASSGTTHPHHTQAVPVPIPVAPELPSIPPPPLSNNTQHPPPHNHTGATANLNMMMHQIAPPSDNTNTAQQKNKDDKNKNGEVGSGRAIPIKQGHLRKWGTKPLNKEWKRKYVTLTDNGKLTYHQTINDYMDDVPGKEINLVCTTVKIPGMKPRGSRGSNPPQSTPPVNGDNPAGPGFDSVAQRLALNNCDESVVIPNASLTANGFFLDGVEYPLPPSVPPNHPSMGSSYPPHPSSHHIIHSASAPGGVGGMPGGGIAGGGASGSPGGANKPESHTPNVKKRHRRAKSGHNRKNDPNDGDDSDDYEFVIVSIENKSWQFAATSVEERDDWVNAIEQQILSSLQANISTKTKTKTTTKLADTGASQLIRVVNGNYYCVDCEAPNPDWASLNLGVLMCIECSGSHRNLGVHLSRVRSLDLDDWCPEHVPVMVSIGNTLANSIWEANLHNRQKPQPNSPREDKEKWIRDKYADKLFLPPLPYVDVKLSEQLIDAVARQNIQNAIIVLAYTTNDHVNTPYSDTDTRTALHIASALGNPALVQLLIWYGADVSLIDHEGRNALWYARSSRSTECVDVLCAAGCVDNTKPPPRPNLITTAPGIGPMGPPTNSNVGLDYHHRRGGALPPPPPVQSHHS